MLLKRKICNRTWLSLAGRSKGVEAVDRLRKRYWRNRSSCRREMCGLPFVVQLLFALSLYCGNTPQAEPLFIIVAALCRNSILRHAARIGLHGGGLSIRVAVNGELDGVIAGDEKLWSAATARRGLWRCGS
jgi:hypothetical protein